MSRLEEIYSAGGPEKLVSTSKPKSFDDYTNKNISSKNTSSIDDVTNDDDSIEQNPPKKSKKKLIIIILILVILCVGGYFSYDIMFASHEHNIEDTHQIGRASCRERV